MLKRLYHRYIRFIYTVKTFYDHAARLNRSVDVEQALNQVAAGKRGPLTPEECRKLANFLGCPLHRSPSSPQPPYTVGLRVDPIVYRLTWPDDRTPRIAYDGVVIAATQFDKEGIPCTWVIRRGGNCLNKEGEWEYEMQPSSRDTSFMSRTRYTSYQEAVTHTDKFHANDPE